MTVTSGEGATSEGDWHEAMNFTGIHSLPLIFVIENNLYAISVPLAEEVARSVASRAAGYGITGVEVDGNDVLSVYGVMQAAVERVRTGQGPSLIEAKTYRYHAHTSDDDDKVYRTAEEVELWRRKDPITVLPPVPRRIATSRRSGRSKDRGGSPALRSATQCSTRKPPRIQRMPRPACMPRPSSPRSRQRSWRLRAKARTSI